MSWGKHNINVVGMYFINKCLINVLDAVEKVDPLNAPSPSGKRAKVEINLEDPKAFQKEITNREDRYVKATGNARNLLSSIPTMRKTDKTWAFADDFQLEPLKVALYAAEDCFKGLGEFAGNLIALELKVLKRSYRDEEREVNIYSKNLIKVERMDLKSSVGF